MVTSPLSELKLPTFPHEGSPVGKPPAPKPILESGDAGDAQSFSWLPMMPIRTFEPPTLPMTLKPSLLQFSCREASEPISFFYVLRPSEVAQ